MTSDPSGLSDPVLRFLRRSARLERRARLRIMSSGEVMDVALKVYQRAGGHFLRAAAVPAVFSLVGWSFLMEILPALGETSSGNDVALQVGEFIVTLALGVLVGGPLVLVGVAFSSAAVVSLTRDYLLGLPLDPEGAREAARRTAPAAAFSLLWSALLASVGILGSALLTALSGLLSEVTPDTTEFAGVVAMMGLFGIAVGFLYFFGVFARYALAVPAAVLEGLKGRAAARRSAELQRGHRFQVAGTGTAWAIFISAGLVLLLLMGGYAAGLEMTGAGRWIEGTTRALPLSGLWEQAVSLLPVYLAFLLLVPAVTASLTILYFERRVRLEGYDIDALASDVVPRS